MERRALHTHKGIVTEWEPEAGLPEEPAGDAKLDSAPVDRPAVEVPASPAEPTLISQEFVDKVTSADAEDGPDVIGPVGSSTVIDGVSSPPPIPFVQPTEDTKVEEKVEAKKGFFKSKREKWIFGIFIAPPFAISFISMMHMVALFEASNDYWMAVAIAVAVELAAMSSLVALVTLEKLNKTTIWSIFGVLASLQIIGNMYHTMVNMKPESQQSILNLLALDSTPWSLRLVLFLVGGILPVIALTFVKGIVDYFKE